MFDPDQEQEEFGRMAELKHSIEHIAKQLEVVKKRLYAADVPATVRGNDVLSAIDSEVIRLTDTAPEKVVVWTTGKRMAHHSVLRFLSNTTERLSGGHFYHDKGQQQRVAFERMLKQFAETSVKAHRSCPIEISVSTFTYSTGSLYKTEFGGQERRTWFGQKQGSEYPPSAQIPLCLSSSSDRPQVLFRSSDWWLAGDQNPISGRRRGLQWKASDRFLAGVPRLPLLSFEERVRHFDYDFDQEIIAPLLLFGKVDKPGRHLGVIDLRVRCVRHIPTPLGIECQRLSMVLRPWDLALYQIFTNCSKLQTYVHTNPGTEGMILDFASSLRG